MLLAFDIGNTNMVIGIYEDGELKINWRITTDRQKTYDEYGMLLFNLFTHHNISKEKIDAVIFSSVVPPIMAALEDMSRKYFNVEPMVIGPGIKTGIPILYENPREVGADRIVNAVAGIEKYGAPLIIVDFGTATTFCAISEKGEYLGGVITPGVNISLEALVQRTSKLPKIELIKPKKVVGKNTINAMQAGMIYGYTGLVDEIIFRIKEEQGWENPTVIATGGIAELIAKDTKYIQKVDKYLTLDGLRIIYEKNKGEK